MLSLQVSRKWNREFWSIALRLYLCSDQPASTVSPSQLMEVYSWDTVQSSILNQAEVAHSPIPEAFFDRNNFFLPKGLGSQLKFFEGMN